MATLNFVSSAPALIDPLASFASLSSSPPRLLALDTSTPLMCVALCADGAVYTHTALGSAEASARLLPAVSSLLQQAGLVLSQLQAVAFARGPGAFTGLRVACAVAQGLGFGVSCPVLPLDSLLVVAEDAAAQHAPDIEAPVEVGVAMDARMGELYAARYRREGGCWHVQSAPALCTPDALLGHWQGVPAVVAGSGLVLLPDGAVLQPARHRCDSAHDRAAALMRLAQQAWGQGAGMEAGQALPLYLRDRVALTSAERAQRAALVP